MAKRSANIKTCACCFAGKWNLWSRNEWNELGGNMPGNTAWTPEEDATLRIVWRVPGPIKTTVAPMLPGRSLSAIGNRASTLGLGKRPPFARQRYSPAWESIEQLLSSRPNLSVWEISRMTGVPRSTVIGCIRGKHRVRAVHVTGHVHEGSAGRWERCWTLGEGKDKEPPKARTVSQRAAAQWKRLKSNKEAYDLHLSRRKVKYAHKTGRHLKREPLMTALYGAPDK